MKGNPMKLEIVPLTVRGEAAIIHLTKSYYCLVDIQDWKWLSKWRWTASEGGRKDKRYVYATRQKATGRAPGRTELMHREITNAAKGQQVDHLNHNTLDNRRANLRIGTHAENCQNRRKLNGCQSRFKGVTRCSGSSTWQASVKHQGKRIHLGCFKTEEEAARARDAAVVKYHANATLNFN